MFGSLLVCALVLRVPGGVLAQDAEPLSVADAERIAKMRDLSASGDADRTEQASAQAEPGGQDARTDGIDDEGAQEDTPLPPNESLPLGTGGGIFSGDGTATSASGAGGDGWMLSTLAALGVVIGLVFLIRWVLRRGGVVSTSSPKGSVVEVLSRTTVAPRSHVLLLRVGPRVLVVSDSQSGMRTLSEVTEPEEVADLLGAVDASAPTSLSGSFNGVMKKLSGQWTDADDADLETKPQDAAGDGVQIDKARGAVSSVRGRLAALSRVGGES